MRHSYAHGTADRYSRSLFKPIFITTLIVLSLLMLSTPSTFAALQKSAASANSISLSWTATGDDGSTGTASQYDIRYSTAIITPANWDAATQVTGEPLPQPSGTVQSFTVTGLNPGTTYYFAMKAADEVPNWSPLSNVVSGTTDNEAIPPAQVADLAAGNATASTINLTWTAPGDDGNVGTATQYDIRYSTAVITDANWDAATPVSGEPAPAAAGTPQSYTVTGLNPSTTYYFGIKTADEVANWSLLSNIPSLATTGETTAPAAVANLNALLPTQTSLTLVWTAPGDDGNTGTATQYDIRYSTNSINNGTWNSATQISGEPTPSVAGTPESLTVTGLAENTTYYFAIKTADEVPNWSALSNIASGTTTLDQTPPAPINDLIAVEGQATGSVDLTWTAPGDDGLFGTATMYEIRYAHDSLTETNWETATVNAFPPVPVASGLPQTATLAGLTPGDMYYVGIKAYDDAGNASVISNCDTAVAKVDLSLGNDENEDNLPTTYELAQNFPNPFNPSTMISVTLPRSGEAELVVFNSTGQQVKTLLTGMLAAGEHSVEWNGTDDTGRPVATGVYYYRLAANDFVQTKKMMLLK